MSVDDANILADSDKRIYMRLISCICLEDLDTSDGGGPTAKKKDMFLQRHAALVSEGWRAKEYIFFFRVLEGGTQFQ